MKSRKNLSEHHSLFSSSGKETFQLLFEHHPLPMWIYDLETLRFLAVNGAAIAKYGYSEQEFLNLTIKDIRPAEDIPALLENVARIGDGLDDAGIWRHRKKDGSIIAVEITSHALRFDDRKGELVLAHDITGRVLAEAKLRDNEERFRLLFENSVDAILLTSPDGSIIAANPAACKVFGKSEAEICRTGRAGIVDMADPRLARAIEERMRTGTFRGELNFIRGDGSLFPAEVASNVFKDSGGNERTTMIIRDLTEQKRSELALRESEERYRNLLDVAPVGIAVHCEGKIVFTNKAGMEILGATAPEQLIGKPIAAIIHPDGLAEARERIQRMMGGEEGLYPAEDRYIRLDGKIIDVEVMASLLTYQGKPAVQVIVTDITERKKAEELLRSSEEKFSMIFKKAPFAASLARISDGTIEEVNEEFERVLGYSREEVIGKTSLDLGIYPDPEERAKSAAIVRKYGFAHNVEMRLQTKQGCLRDFLLNTDFVQIGEEKYVLTTAKDITERKLAEEKLQLSETTLKLFVEFAPAAIAMFDLEMKYIAASNRFLADYRLPVGNVIGKSHYEIFPEIPERWKEIHKRCLAGSIEKADEDPFYRGDGTLDWIRWEIHPWYKTAGEIGGIILFSEVITERKKTEEKLRESEQKFRLIAENARDIVYLYRFFPTRGFEYISPSVTHITGYTPEEHYADPDLGFRLVHPDDRHLLEETSAGRVNPDTTIILRWVRKEGTIVWTEQRNIPIKDSKGNIIALEGIARDITDRKKAEEDLRLYSERLEKAEMHAGLGSWEFDLRTTTGWWSKEMFALMGFQTTDTFPTPEEYLEHVYPDDRKIVQEALTNITHGIVTAPHIYRSNPKYGPLRYLAPTIGVEKDQKGVPIRLYGTVSDVTEQKKSERQILKLNRVYAVLSNINQAIVRVHDVPSLFNEACRIAVEDGKFLLAWIGMLDETGCTIKVAASAGIPEPFVERLNIDLTDERWSNCPTGRSIKTGNHAISMDIQNDELMVAWKEIALAVGCNSSTAFPLKVFGKTVGSFNIYSQEVGYFDDDEIKLLAELASDISFALEFTQQGANRKQAEELQRSIEQKYREVVETANEVIYTTDLKGYFTYVNPAGTRKTGYSSEEFRRLNYLDLILPEHRPKVKKFYLRQFAEKLLSAQYQFPFASKSGEVIWFEQNSTLLMEDGTVTGMQFIARDITERKRMEDALSESTERFRQLTENIREIFWLTDSVKNTMLYVSPAYESIWGQTLESLYAAPMKWFDVIHPDDKERILHAVRTKQADGTYDETYRITRPDGAVRWIHDRAYPIKDHAGAVYRIAGVAEDITNQTTNEESRKILEAQLLQAQKLESLGTLASGIAHDFNNILGIIIAHSSMLAKMAVTPEMLAKSGDAITKAGMRGAALVKQMLTFARKTDVTFTAVRVNEIVSEISKLIGETFPKTIEVSIRIENELPLITADPTQVHQVLLNLCVNARDAMPNGGTLMITTRRESGAAVRRLRPKTAEEEYVELSVRDTGTGMSEEIQRRIFEPFFTTKELGKGTGLGLSLVFGIMETHNGFVEVQSSIGEGTAFHCYFPTPHRTEKQDAAPAMQDAPLEGSETILFVEDEELLQDLIKRVLESKGYSVLTANDGEEGLRKYALHQTEIDLVVSDMGLPKFGGYEMFQKIKAINPGIRLVFASGYIEPGTKEKILNEGVKRFIQKPYELNEVLRAVREALR